MITLRLADQRGHARHGWLDSHHSFSFGDYYDPAHMSYRALRVLNDDTVAPGEGFPSHPHRDMEIISYVLSGSLAHRDSTGAQGVIEAGDFQWMSAGSGVTHSEFNPSPVESVHFLQVWLRPRQQGLPPAYAELRGATAQARGQLLTVAAPDGPLPIRADASLHLADLETGERAIHAFGAGRFGYLHVAEGSVLLNGNQTLRSGDAALLEQELSAVIEASSSSRVLLFDLA